MKEFEKMLEREPEWEWASSYIFICSLKYIELQDIGRKVRAEFRKNL